jgi:hypothetical protein
VPSFRSCEATVGPHHDTTFTARNNLAAVLHGMGRYEDAVPILRAVLAGHVALQGEDHLTTVSARDNLANVLIDVGRHAEAAGLLDRCVRDYRRIYGPGNPRLLAAEERLAWLRDNPAPR